MPKKVLTDEGKKFVVMSLAVFDSPTDVVQAVREKFGVTITRQSVEFYDPTKVAGMDLSENLKTLFYETRKKWDETFEDSLPLLKKHNRIKELSKYARNAAAMGNEVGAAGFIEQIAKEEGGLYTNKRDFNIKNFDVSKLTDEELSAIIES